MRVEIKYLDPRVETLAPATPMSAGYDLVACIDKPLVVRYGDPAILVPTGIAVFVNHSGYASLILPRSGLGHKKGLVLGNTLGLIDADYQNQLFISVWNRGNGANSRYETDYPSIIIQPMERIAQLVFVPILRPVFVAVETFSEASMRGLGGWGSTS